MQNLPPSLSYLYGPTTEHMKMGLFPHPAIAAAAAATASQHPNLFSVESMLAARPPPAGLMPAAVPRAYLPYPVIPSLPPEMMGEYVYVCVFFFCALIVSYQYR